MANQKKISAKVPCAHCGDPCPPNAVQIDDLSFCCQGCATIYRILKDNDLSQYYQLDERPGISQRGRQKAYYDYLDDEDIIDRLLDFREGGIAVLSFDIPQIHCASCIWLLENLHRLDKGVLSSRVNFLKKSTTIRFDENRIRLKELVLLLARIGYEPTLSLSSLDERRVKGQDKKLLYKLGLAGFVFGNIMLLSFPEYLGFDKAALHLYIGYISLVLATPVLLYSGIDYLKAAGRGLRTGYFSIDVPVALGMFALFGRSAYEILSKTGEGYLDSFSGFIFFLLIGKWFQNYTFQAMSFERDYKSYFPISGLVWQGERWLSRSIDALQIGDQVLVKNQEIIPTDALIIRGEGKIDYSFVSGESRPISKKIGEKVLAGGRQLGGSMEVQVLKKVDQSYLTKLWDEDVFQTVQPSGSSKLIDLISQYFTIVIIGVATASFIGWLYIDKQMAYQVFTAVLIVACPCALALAGPFIYGNMIRLSARADIYCRNTHTIEQIQDITRVVFDKTGTITDVTNATVTYIGRVLTTIEKQYIKSLAFQSNHPLSRAIDQYFDDTELLSMADYREWPGLGLSARIRDIGVRLGSSAWLGCQDMALKDCDVVIEIAGICIGGFMVRDDLRRDIGRIITNLAKRYKLSMISGDDDNDRQRMQDLFSDSDVLFFNQSPQDKLDYIKSLQADGQRVMMIGDGLNDAGALRQADVGVVLSDKTNNFTPASDIIIDRASFKHFYSWMDYARSSVYIIYGALIFAFAYNLIGLYFAISGRLSPVVAAILMPISSITVIVYGVSVSSLLYRVFNKSSSKTD